MAARALFLWIPLFLILIITGCARQRWTEPLQEDESRRVSELITAMQDTNKTCPKGFDADAIISWKSPVTDTAVQGYLQLLSPSSVKFIVSNPLGMPIYAFASDGNTFQILDTSKRQHIRGNVRNLAFRKELPIILAQGDWFSFLSGQLPSQAIYAEQISKDTTNETVWVRFPKSEKIKTADEQWVNLDPGQRKVLGYLFLDRSGETIAEISYENKKEDVNCLSGEKKIRVTDLPWGAEIEIELHDIRTDDSFSEADFSLPVPVGYFKQLQP